jgi:hypothetical protein
LQRLLPFLIVVVLVALRLALLPEVARRHRVRVRSRAAI